MVEGEDIPHISHIQDILKVVNKLLKIPPFLVKKIFEDPNNNNSQQN